MKREKKKEEIEKPKTTPILEELKAKSQNKAKQKGVAKRTTPSRKKSRGNTNTTTTTTTTTTTNPETEPSSRETPNTTGTSESPRVPTILTRNPSDAKTTTTKTDGPTETESPYHSGDNTPAGTINTHSNHTVERSPNGAQKMGRGNGRVAGARSGARHPGGRAPRGRNKGLYQKKVDPQNK